MISLVTTTVLILSSSKTNYFDKFVWSAVPSGLCAHFCDQVIGLQFFQFQYPKRHKAVLERCSDVANMKGAATHATSGSVSDWPNGERPFYELFSSYRRKSFIVKLELRTQFLFGCNKYRDFRRFFFSPKKA